MSYNTEILARIHAIRSDKERIIKEIEALIKQHEAAGVHPSIIDDALSSVIHNRPNYE